MKHTIPVKVKKALAYVLLTIDTIAMFISIYACVLLYSSIWYMMMNIIIFIVLWFSFILKLDYIKLLKQEEKAAKRKVQRTQQQLDRRRRALDTAIAKDLQEESSSTIDQDIEDLQNMLQNDTDNHSKTLQK